jgi:putative membrane protein
VATQFLDAEARAAFARAVETIENSSAVEVVIAVRQRSGVYRHANVIVAAIVAFAGLAAMLFSEHTFGLASVLVDPFVVGALAGLLVELLPQVKRGLTSRARLHAEVQRAARATFVERGVHATTGRSGVLVYISWLEQELALVPDLGLAAQLPEDALPDAEERLRDLLAAGGAAVAAELERLAPMMGSAMPHRDDDVNELPDAIDSDMDRGPADKSGKMKGRRR